MEKLVLFGIGLVGTRVFNDLMSKNIDIECFIDNNKEVQGTMKFDKPVISLEDYISKELKNQIIITTNSYQEIIQQLVDNNIDNYVTIEQFIDNNIDQYNNDYLANEQHNLRNIGSDKIKNVDKRRETIFKNCDLHGKGLEIAPYFNPLIPKISGVDIENLDCLDKDTLKERARTNSNIPLYNAEKVIEEVDYVWSGERYPDLIGKTNYYDYILSSHLIEHIPDLIRHFEDCSKILKDGGVYSLAIPDKRLCFDYFRPLTTIKDCINSYYRNESIHGKGNMIEYMLYKANNNWLEFAQNGKSEEISLYHNIDEKRFREIMDTKEYINIHNSVFVPSSFELLIKELNYFGLIDLIIENIESSKGIEFYVTLKKSKEKYEMTKDERLELLKKIQNELVEHMKIQVF